ITEQNAQAASKGQHTGERNQDWGQGHSLGNRIRDLLLGKMKGAGHQENQHEEESPQNDNRTLGSSRLCAVGNYYGIRCHVLPPYESFDEVRCILVTINNYLHLYSRNFKVTK